jgi:DNA polymerase-1
MAATSTGRLSSSDPNLQNIPIRTRRAAIRTAFVAEKGKADLGRLQPDRTRVLAHVADIRS